MRVLLDPREHVLQARGLVGRPVAQDVLRLPAAALQRGDGQARRVGGDGRAVVAAHDVQAQVQPGGRTGGGENPAVVGVEHVRIDPHRRVAAGELVRGRPVGRGVAAVEQPGLGEAERADADRGHPRPALHRRAQRFQHRAGRRPERVVAPRHDHEVRALQHRQVLAHRQPQRPGVDLGFRTGDEDAVAGPVVGQSHPGERLDRRGQIESDRVVEREHHHGLHFPILALIRAISGARWRWPDPVGCWPNSHWEFCGGPLRMAGNDPGGSP